MSLSPSQQQLHITRRGDRGEWFSSVEGRRARHSSFVGGEGGLVESWNWYGQTDSRVILITMGERSVEVGGWHSSLYEGRGRLVDRRGVHVINSNMYSFSSFTSFSRI